MQVDLPNAIDLVVLPNRFPAVVVAEQRLVDDHRQIARSVPDSIVRIAVDDIVDREIVISPVAQVLRNAFAFGIQRRAVEDLARPDEPVGRILEDDFLDEAVVELIADLSVARRRALFRAVGDDGPFGPRRRIDMIIDARREESVRFHVDLEILGRLDRQCRVVNDRFFSDLALEAVPPVLFGGIRLIVHPDIEIRPQKSFVGALPDVPVQFGGRNALFLGDAAILFDGDFLYQITPLGKFAHDTARRAEQAQRREGGKVQRTHRNQALKNPCSRSSSK